MIFRLLCLVTGLVLLAGCGPRDPHKLVIGMETAYPPFEMLDEKGNFSGVSVDLGKALAQELGKEVEFKNIAFDGLVTALKTSQIDLIISSMTATDEKRKSIDFSTPYVRIGLALLIGKKSPVQTVDDLKVKGRKVVVRLGTTGEAYARANLPEAELLVLDTDTACVMEVVKGGADAWIYDQLSVLRYHDRYPEETRMYLHPLQEEFWAIGLRKGDDKLKEQINAALKKIRADGVFQQLSTKHLGKSKAAMSLENIPFVFDVGLE